MRVGSARQSLPSPVLRVAVGAMEYACMPAQSGFGAASVKFALCNMMLLEAEILPAKREIGRGERNGGYLQAGDFGVDPWCGGRS
jgi:hypothetical protein